MRRMKAVMTEAGAARAAGGRGLFVSAGLALAALALSCPVGSSAQGRQSAARARARRAEQKQAAKAERAPAQKEASGSDAVRLVNASGSRPGAGPGAREQIWGGNATVVISGNDDPVVRVHLSIGGSVTFEFPAGDPYFVIHPPQPKPSYVVVDDSPTKKTDRYFIFRPGEDFIAPQDGTAAKPIATINVQMRSGLFVTILVYPTNDLSLNAHHVLLKYNPSEIVAARRAAGLAVYLGDEGEQKPPAVARPIRNDESAPGAQPSGDEKAKGLRDYAVAAHAELARFTAFAVQSGAREVAGLGQFGKEVNGLRVAAADIRQLGPNARVAVVAVQNKRERRLRIAQGQPVLMVDTGRAGRAGESRPVKVLYFETDSAAGVVEGRQTVFYAIVYELPTAMGSSQTVRASVSEDRAVDRLASVEVARN